MSPRIAPVLLVLACRPEQSSTQPIAAVPAAESPSMIPEGDGVIVRPGATVWLDAAGEQPLTLPTDLAGDGVQMRVVADRGETLEAITETSSECRSPVVGDFALRFFIARGDLRDATSAVLESTLPDGKRVIVQPGVPVDGAAGSRTVAIALMDGVARVDAPDAGVAKHFVVASQEFPCIEVLEHGKPVRTSAAATSDTSTRARFVVPGRKAYWRSGSEAGAVAFPHAFHEEPTIAGARTCFPLRLAEGNATMLCFDNESVFDGTGQGGPAGGVDLDGAPGGVPRVRQAVATVKGALDKDIVRRIVRAHINEVRHCYNVALKTAPDEKGRVTIQFAIGGAGDVLAADVADSSVTSTDLPKCIATAIKRWKFPKPEGGGNVVVTYPFILEPG